MKKPSIQLYSRLFTKYLDFLALVNTLFNRLKYLIQTSWLQFYKVLFLSDQFPAERGCRHEDPVAPYLFVLCAEVLSTLIKQNNDLKVIVIHDMDQKKGQYSNDTS